MSSSMPVRTGTIAGRPAHATPSRPATSYPGEYTKLYVPNAEHFRAQSIIDGMRSGNSYSVNADIIGPDLVFRARGRDDDWKTMGETLVVRPGEKITVEMAMTVPAKNNSPYSFNNPLLQQVGIHQPLNKPSLDHVDLITGHIAGVIPPGSPGYAVPNAGGVAGAAIVYNPTTTISQQIHANNMRSTRLRDGSTELTFTTTFTAGTTPSYIRARGTNIPVATPNVTDSAGNPLLDVNNALVSCTDPACPAHLATVNGVKKVTFDVQAYSNVWFYANPIFIRPEGSPKLLVEQNADLARRLAERPITTTTDTTTTDTITTDTITTATKIGEVRRCRIFPAPPALDSCAGYGSRRGSAGFFGDQCSVE